ncbi:hypothetical protein RhiirA1_473219 [Rhizophagus irregularis]|uniref:Uncharacterized protein n=1 Tax=Rhizophagus irregularis TaxID=588596 RepID=A0A2N0R0Z4_9GLOM|nr:hypothetical protein RhiirA1_473219 [Rhizophagus irregularis]
MLAIKHEGVRNLMPNAEAWIKIKDTIIVSEPLERATKKSFRFDVSNNCWRRFCIWKFCSDSL